MSFNFKKYIQEYTEDSHCCLAVDFIIKSARVRLFKIIIMQSNSDWDKVTIIRKSKPAAKDLKSAAAINKAMASGNAEITRKSNYIFSGIVI